MADIAFDKVSFRYPGSTEDTLSDLSLRIRDGEAHALLGASGAGKTTLLNLLSGLLAPTRGALYFGADDVSQKTGRARNVARVFQFPVLYESLSVSDNLLFPLRTRGTAAGLMRERLNYIGEELAITDLFDQKPAALSLFQKQLVAVGKALVRPDVSLVLLDEPLTAVEPRTKWRLRQTLRRVQEDLKVTMIYVTHDQTEALTFAERVSILAHGSILQTGSPEEVYNSPAHEFVGHFVGSPGMNFLPGSDLGIESAERIGFRPEWIRVLAGGENKCYEEPPSGLLHGQVRRVRIQGTQGGQPYGLLRVQTAGGDIAIRDTLPEGGLAVGDVVRLRVQHCVAFNEQRQVGTYEFV